MGEIIQNCKLNRNTNNISFKIMLETTKMSKNRKYLGTWQYLYVKLYYILTLNNFLMTL